MPNVKLQLIYFLPYIYICLLDTKAMAFRGWNVTQFVAQTSASQYGLISLVKSASDLDKNFEYKCQ